MRVLAVDFGTSNTVAAVAVDGSPPRTLAIDGSPLLPSSVFLTDEGTIAVGRDADRQARLDPSRYEPNPKRRIDDGEILLGAEVVAVRQAVSAVLGRVAQEFRRQNAGQSPDVVRLTHPARWRQARKDVLIAAARDAGLGDAPILVPEPVGAATHFAMVSGHTMAPGAAIAVYDLGGGTFDVAIVQKRGENFEVLAEAGLPDLGGLDFDQAIWEYIGRSHGRSKPDDWTRLIRPSDTASRRAQRALAVDVKEGKEALSRHPHTDIALPDPFSDVHVTRSEFEELIRPNLARSVELLATTIGEADFTPAQLAGVYLVGGSSRIPLVARLIQEGLGITPTTLDQPEVTVVSGALYLQVGPPPGAAQPTAAPGPTQGPPPVAPGQGRPPTGPHPGQRPPVNSGAMPRPQQAPQGPPQGAVGRPHLPPVHPQQRPISETTRRVNPSELPALNTVRPMVKPPSGAIRRIGNPADAVGQPIRSARPSTGAQPTGPRSGIQPAVPRPPVQRPPAQNAPANRPPQNRPAPPTADPTNFKPIIWASVFAVIVVLIAILIINLA